MTNHTPVPTSNVAEDTFRIGELAREFDVTLRTLRFYEDKGLLSPRRIGNLRLYSRGDRARLRIILLGKRVGFSLKDIREILELYDPDGDNSRQLKVSIDKGEAQLRKLHADRDQLDSAIDELDTTLANLRMLLEA
ncbi:MAG: MerR family DNA-binding transcriptional regulator [Pseudomonadota bacterium]